MQSQRTIDDWFDEYAKYHLNATNKTIHWICIPLITISLLGLLWSIPLPAAVTSLSPWLNCATLFATMSLVFYCRLSVPIATGMAISAGTMLLVIYVWASQFQSPVWQGSLAIFVIAWIGQFVGHKIEGRKPAFAEDIQFLLIGPAWLLGFIYKRFGIAY